MVNSDTKVKILVIDDHAVELGYKQMLSMLGAEVEIEASGHRGVQRASRFQPDIILLDYNMPGLNGLEVAQRLRGKQQTAHIPIIMITMHDEPEYFKQAADPGIKGFMSKPIDPDLLKTLVYKVTGKTLKSDFDNKPITQPLIGILYNREPAQIMPDLVHLAKDEWPKLLLTELRNPDIRVRGRAVIALAAWQKEDISLYNITDGQYTFWKHVRHSLASSKTMEAETRWGRLSPIAFALMHPPEKATPMLQECAKIAYWECRSWALRILHTNREMVTIDLAASAILDDSGEVRTMAAMVLAEMGTTRHIPLLAQAMSDTEPGVREHAAAALARIGGELSINVLATVLLKNRAGAAEAAANGLALMATEEAVDALIEAINQRNEPAVLQQIAHALGKIQRERGYKVLQALAQHPDETVRQAAMVYLAGT